MNSKWTIRYHSIGPMKVDEGEVKAYKTCVICSSILSLLTEWVKISGSPC